MSIMNLKEYKQNYAAIFQLLKTLTFAQINFKPDKDKWSIHEIINASGRYRGSKSCSLQDNIG